MFELYGARACLIKLSASITDADMLSFFKNTPYPDADRFESWCEQQGCEKAQALAVVFRLATKFTNLALGGKSRGEKHQVDEDELAMGVNVELEHTKDKDVSEKIARDHLAEHPKYYTALKKMEDGLKAAE